jgi:AcrR family transcriptional regulator
MTKEQLGEALRDLVIDKLTEKKVESQRKATKARSGSAKARLKADLKAELQAEAIDALTDRLSALDIWTRVPPQRRQPRLTREDLAATAVRLADAEGLGALSMRRLATELDVGTMTLYHYVRTKDELLTLVTDAVMGETVVPSSMTIPDDWRAALTLLASRTRAALVDHPWMLDINDDPPIGPNSVRHFDQSLAAVASLDVALADKLDIISAVDEYTFGYSRIERNSRYDHALDDEDEMVEYVSVLIETGAYPHLAALTDEMGVRPLWRTVHTALRDERRFNRNLDRLLDGIAASVR